jgi:hypothetical protein
VNAAPPRAPAWGPLVGALLLALLSACSALGLAPAQSFGDRLGYAYGTHTAILQATARARDAGSLSSTDVQHVTAAADQARALLDGARAIQASDPGGASTRLQSAVAILTELQTWLRARGASP